MTSQKNLQQLTMEKDQALADLNSVERSLSDLFRRYENLKGVLEGFKKVLTLVCPFSLQLWSLTQGSWAVTLHVSMLLSAKQKLGLLKTFFLALRTVSIILSEPSPIADGFISFPERRSSEEMCSRLSDPCQAGGAALSGPESPRRRKIRQVRSCRRLLGASRPCREAASFALQRLEGRS